jgi:hypothetical protein
MRNLLFIILLASSSLFGQKYNTKIDKAKKVEIKGGVITITKADSVFIGQIIINQSVKTKIYLTKSIRTQDSSGIYQTSYTFAPYDNPGVYFIDIVLKFDKTFLPFRIRDFKIIGIFQGSTWANDALNEIYLKGQVQAENCTVIVNSKEPLFATIYGVDGKLN